MLTVTLGRWALHTLSCYHAFHCFPHFSLLKSAFPAGLTASTLLTFHSDMFGPDLKVYAHPRDATFLGHAPWPQRMVEPTVVTYRQCQITLCFCKKDLAFPLLLNWWGVSLRLFLQFSKTKCGSAVLGVWWNNLYGLISWRYDTKKMFKKYLYNITWFLKLFQWDHTFKKLEMFSVTFLLAHINYV